MAEERSDWHADRPVLVTNAEWRPSIAVIRSLGRAGYPVHAAAAAEDAIGCRSNFACRAAAHPPDDSDEFLPWLRDYVATHNIRCINVTEALLLAIRPAFAEFAHLLPLSRDEALVYRGMSKFDMFDELSREPGAGHLPPILFVRRSDELPREAEIDDLGAPLFVKTDGCHSTKGSKGVTVRTETPAEARNAAAALLSDFDRVLIQGYRPGQGIGASFAIWDGEFLGEFMHIRLHEVPPSNASSYRSSWWHEFIAADAKAKLKQLSWQGAAMMEYRWNRETDDFALIEMNGRFWGSLHLPIYSGVDFPALLVDAFFGRKAAPVSGRAAQVRCRYYPMEILYVLNQLQDRRSTIAARLWPVLEFFLLMLTPRIKSDLWFPGDRKLHWLRFRQMVLRTAQRLLRSRRPANG